MATVVTGHPTDDVKHVLPVSPASSSIMAPQDRQTTSPPELKPGYDGERGRRRSRSVENESEEQGADGEGNQAHSSNSDGPTRKRRRSRKGLDKKFECPHEGCGKSYSRAEHLYRHQLNHNPKQIYHCDYPDCKRTFVRLDLCNRHKDRHTAKGSSLNRKDSIARSSPAADRGPQYGPAGSASPEVSRPGPGFPTAIRTAPLPYQSPKDHIASPYSPVAHTPPAVFANGVDTYIPQDGGYGAPTSRRSSFHAGNTPRPTVQTNVNSYGVLSPVSTQHGFHSQQTTTPQSVAYVPQQNFPPFKLPPSNFADNAAREQEQQYPPATSAEYTENGQQPAELMMLDSMSATQALPVFGNDSIENKSPHFLPDDILAYLLNHQTEPNPAFNQMGGGYAQSYFENTPNYGSIAYLGPQWASMGYFPAASQQVMAVSSILDQNLPEATISDEKSNEIYEFIRDRFNENGRAPVERQRDSILEGDRMQDDHMLSKRMMQAYIGSYWLHFSDQIPILHKPTFSPDRTPNLLLISMMTIGAACLDKTHGTEVTQAGSKLSNFLAWHIRWEIFMDPNFRPPAKLWVFQSLLLLEVYEKMYSTRELHERAHIHHATTITLMRRGRSLIGKSALDSPPNPVDQRSGGGTNGSRQSSASGVATPNEWWNHWITNEATRRAAFAAFVIDSIHATMFGHSTVMVAHEMRLPLPCDEGLWKATSSAEVGRIENNLLSNNIKPISFLEGLKRTLSGEEVRTNSFGRTVLMAGLLSVTWHMNQRDLQVNVLGGGVSQALGGRDKWRGTLNRAFDSWKNDYDKALRLDDNLNDPYRYEIGRRDDSVANENRVVLHHLAHMAMHVDVIDCQIFARAKRLLGRTIGPQDLNSAQRRMKELWAPSAKARDAMFYALKFLCSVLMPEAIGGSPHGPEPYSARDDVLLDRPWVLYFAALVVWCYGFATEGACPTAPQPSSRAEKLRLTQEYLLKFGGIQSPDDLRMAKGINHNTGLLMMLKDTFQGTRWELLHEGANLLNNCINLNAGRSVP
ncbi:hypothetical protein SAPIO_CDS7192 [Scedosporium apiospermum]|uniref:C2H2-type domain-containing protein n=1 Tax=Pseudallescheria apiosperma TaxID=563466 RepID=A0A084G1B3_PSEDA|nr:uncharacterized protein SAPIO_CDS7192 [Scedosporium apiospermum]KEZ41125.1 hypothetical protein SAPIO_CDS7192 [Scedosporium apiospermum]